MSTVVHHNDAWNVTAKERFFPCSNSQPSWVLVIDQEHLVHGDPGEWANYADVQDVDGLQAYVTKEKLSSLVVKTGYPYQVLTPPEPTHFFSFSRRRAYFEVMTDPGSSDDEKEVIRVDMSGWLFTVFGYLLPEYRVYLTVLPSHSEYQCERRSTPFTIL